VFAFAGGGDVDGDGYGDILFADSDPNDSDGRVDVYQGSSSGLPATPSQTLYATGVPGATSNGQVGNQGDRWIGLLGDVNGDTLSDFAVGVFVPGTGSIPAVYQGSNAISQTPAFVCTGSAYQFW
jgi:hypothetical protein